jgi:serine/threonine protein kinase
MSTRPSNAQERPAPAPARALPIGTRLHGEFDIIGVIHDGSYGISYLASDAAQRRHVVIKEYLPVMLAARAPNYSPEVVLKVSQHAAAFKEGLKAFIHEARLLVAFDTPALVSVLRLWKQNGTAYMVLEKVEGETLRHVLADRGSAPDEVELRGWLNPLLDTLTALHASRCVHGNITPDNIIVGPAGPVLLGFGGGRHAIAKALREPNDALEPGYAAVEQYGNDPAAAQGPWTDLYALASVVYAALTGRAPISAPERRVNDPLVPLRELAGGRFSASLIEAVDAALALWPGERPQNVAAFRALLDREVRQPAGEMPMPHVVAAAPGVMMAPPTPLAPFAAAATPLHPPVVPLATLSAVRSPAPAPSSSAPPVSNRAIVMLALATAVCTIAFGVLGYFAMQPSDGLTLPAPVSKTADPLELPPTSAGPAEAQEPAAASAVAAAPMPPEPTPLAVLPSAPVKLARAAPSSATPPARTAASRARCSDLMQRASLQPLNHDEVESLKRNCR